LVNQILSPKERGYPCAELLVTTEWLADRLNDPQVVIVDNDHPGGYERAHIPGAVKFEDQLFKGSENKLFVQPEEEFAATMSQLGIANDSTVVVYDSDGSHFAARLFWALRYYGHSDVRLLDGGFPKWLAEGRPIERQIPSPAATTFTPESYDARRAIRDDILAGIDESGTAIWDVRTDEEWTGENDRGTARGGRIPSAVHCEWKNLMTDGDVPVYKTADELLEMLGGIGITPEKRVMIY
jgi:thiosulfate/3-mercaptopyruvate sulfurtransferase